ncbi:MAG: hypothetical protein JWO83_4181 [Caulobacteraceae bacterium]|jgi:hypothetical protein|nr:hypothetical protein [Caulobacteraceae bacterium]
MRSTPSPTSWSRARPDALAATRGPMASFRIDWAVSEHHAAAIEAVHFAVAQVIRQAGGHDGDYVGVELKYGW